MICNGNFSTCGPISRKGRSKGRWPTLLAAFAAGNLIWLTAYAVDLSKLRVNEADLAYESRDYALAALRYEQAGAVNLVAHQRLRMAQSLFVLRRHNEALALLETGLERPDADSLLLLADIYRELGDLNASLGVLLRAQWQAPTRPEIAIRVGQLQQQLGNEKAADEAFSTYVRLIHQRPTQSRGDRE